MKKKLEAELISLAHRILKMKNKSDVAALHDEARKIYEALSVLRFAEENLEEVKPTIGRLEVESTLEKTFDAPAEFVAEVETSQEPETADDVIAALASEKEVDEVVAEAETEVEETPEPAEENVFEPVTDIEETAETPAAEESPEEETPADDIFKPAFEWAFEAKEEEPVTPEPVAPATESPSDVKDKLAQAEIAFEDLLGPGYKDPVFVKSDEINTPAKPADEPSTVIPIARAADTVQVIKMNSPEIADRTISLNDRLSKGITVGLNDRIAFVKHLFNNSSEDYNRVLSQLITFGSIEEAREFINAMVKPDYNNWVGKEEYEQRFMEVVEKKFS